MKGGKLVAVRDAPAAGQCFGYCGQTPPQAVEHTCPSWKSMPRHYARRGIGGVWQGSRRPHAPPLHRSSCPFAVSPTIIPLTPLCIMPVYGRDLWHSVSYSSDRREPLIPKISIVYSHHALLQPKFSGTLSPCTTRNAYDPTSGVHTVVT